MKIVQNDLWLCADCTIYACNGDTSGIDCEDRETEVIEAVNALGPHLVSDSYNERDGIRSECYHEDCDACGQDICGEANRFAILAEESDPREDLGVRKYFACSGCGQIELYLTRRQFEACSQGSRDASPYVQELLQVPEVAEQVTEWSDVHLREWLGEFGNWEPHELESRADNVERAVWILACDMREEFGD